MQPDVILVTTQKNASLLHPLPNGYRCESVTNTLAIDGLSLFPEVTNFRKNIYSAFVQNALPDDHEFKGRARGLLTSLQTNWQTDAVRGCARRCYRRDLG